MDSAVFLILASVEDLTSASGFRFHLALLCFSSFTTCSFSVLEAGSLVFRPMSHCPGHSLSSIQVFGNPVGLC